MPRNAVGVMAKYPAEGTVKTRLARDVGDDAALRLYRLLLDRVHERFTGDDSLATTVFITPSDHVDAFRKLYPDFDSYRPQQGDSLGERMANALWELLVTASHDKAILIGCDIPDLGADRVRQAFAALASHDLVLGPTGDGGYYLIGMRDVLRPVFDGPEWGTERVLAQTLDIAANERWAVTLLDRLDDLDTLDDLRRFLDLASVAGITKDR